MKSLQWEDVQLLWTLVTTLGGWLFSVGIFKYIITELNAPRIKVSNVRHSLSFFPRKTKDLLTIQYTIKKTSYLGRLNLQLKPIHDYSF